MADRYLIDLSAWARSSQASVEKRWQELVRGDRLVCNPAFAVELLHNAINPADYHRKRKSFEDAFEWRWPDDETLRLAMKLQQRMADAVACGQRVKTIDLLIAALALQHDLGVLHYDTDYDLIKEHGDASLGSEWLARRGTLDTAVEKGKNLRKAYSKAFAQRMVQLQGDADLDVWPDLIEWMDDQLRERGLDLPNPPDV